MKTAKKRMLRLVAAMLVVAALAVWVSLRWGAWFGQPDEPPYAPLSEPGRVLLTFGDSTELSRNVSWQCDSVLRPSHLELAPADDTLAPVRRIAAQGEVFTSRSGKAAYYHAKLRGLSPATSYRYRVVSGRDTSQWYSFSTRDTSAREFSFIYVGDVQDTVGGISPKILRHIVARHPEAEFLVSGGDFTERPTDLHWGVSLGSVDSICQRLPLLAVTGNHDYLKGLPRKLERRFPLIFSYFLDSMAADNMVYKLRYGDAEFFLLDSSRELPYLWAQRGWLKSALASSTAKWKIVVVHHPLYSLKGKNNNLTVRWAFDDLIRDSGVDLVLQGHEHNYGRMTAKTESGRAVTPLYIVSHCSPKCYSHGHVEGRFDKIGDKGKYYQTISVTPEALTLTAYRIEEKSDVPEDVAEDRIRIAKL